MILQSLRSLTRQQHERLESRLDLLNRVSKVIEYRQLLERFYGFYTPLEPIADKILKTLDFNFQARLKTPLLRKDLAMLGLTENEIQLLPVCADLPDLSTQEKIFGYLYVVEGSTLGGQIISKHFAKKFLIGENNGGSFFRAYGEETGKMWSGFQTAITNFTENKKNRDEIIGAAIETFVKLGNYLSQKESHSEDLNTSPIH